ncbi:glycosyltransferase family 2 protein [Nesterenkonia natronophila]|uniref:Glycosyltransferase family 2 protein n=1 Tax=Nesterenkonia natronophila TaxID=2174932 RepID=A0A3A4F1F4_9MICC|nr:hypothetical protein [Nesterenkonia natronophila]RJN32072.1 hypothetical protein D3250_08285 [Nesterenkonia natronophila]
MSGPAARLHIAAVVLHDGGGFASPQWDAHGRALNTAAGLEWQTRQPDSVIELSSATYTGPQDLSRSLHSGLIRDRRQAKQTLSSGPGGVKSTPLWRTLERQLGNGFAPQFQWLWILSADTVAEPTALEQLEERIFTVKDEETHRTVEVVGAKQWVAGIEEPRLLSAGLWVTRSGEVSSLTEPKELDQGQYDGRDEVPGVSAHGMLVRASLFGDLGGYSPELDDDYAAAEFCARAREVGARTVLESGAAVRRPAPPQGAMVHRLGGSLLLSHAERSSQVRLRLSRAHLTALPFVWLGLWFAAAARLVALLVCKAPDAGLSQFGSSASALVNVAAIWRLRRHRAAGRKAALSRPERAGESPQQVLRTGNQAVREARLSGTTLRDQRRRDTTAETVGVTGQRTAPVSAAPGDEDALLEVGEGDGEFDQLPTRGSGDRLGLFLLLTVLTGISLVGFRDLLTAGALGGGAAAPASSSLNEIWNHTLSFLVADSLGERAAADPFNLVLLIFSAVSLGHASMVLLWIVILAAPLSALTAWWAASLWSSASMHRVITALIWALLPALQAASGQGRVGAVIAHILLPVLVLVSVRAVRLHSQRRDHPGGIAALRLTAGWETAAAAALLMAGVTAAAPVLLVPAVLSCVTAALLLGRQGRVLWMLPIPALAIFLPMLMSTVDRGSSLVAALITEPGRNLPTTEAGVSAPIWQQLLGFSQAFDPAAGLPGAANTERLGWLPGALDADFWALRLALLIGAPLVVIAVLAMLAAGRRLLMMTCGLIALGLVGYSALVSRLAAGTAGGEVLGGHIGPMVSALALCLIAAAIGGLQGGPGSHAVLGGIFTPVASTLLVLAIFASGVFWAAPRLIPTAELADRTITAVNEQQVLIAPAAVRTLPATAADLGAGPAATRTLVLSSSHEGVTAQLRSRSGETLDKHRSAAVQEQLPLWAFGALAEPGTNGSAPGELSSSQQRLGDLVASVVVPGSENTAEIAFELGIGHVLVSEGTALREAVDTASGLTAVGDTEFGALWRIESGPSEELAAPAGVVGAPTAWARIVTADGEPVALLPSEHHRLAADLSAVLLPEGGALELDDGTEYHVQIASERAAGWQATLDGERLRPVTASSLGAEPEEVSWSQQFHLPESFAEDPRGHLELSHSPQFQYPILVFTGALLLIFLLVALPLPRSWRILPVVSDDRLTFRGEGRP